jgi:O-antigen/teichoic acid export membrane protein
MVAPLAGLVANVGLNLAVVPRYGIRGAAITSSAAYLLMLALSLGAFLRRSRVDLRRSLVVGADDLAGLFTAPNRQGGW